MCVIGCSVLYLEELLAKVPWATQFRLFFALVFSPSFPYSILPLHFPKEFLLITIRTKRKWDWTKREGEFPLFFRILCLWGVLYTELRAAAAAAGLRKSISETSGPDSYLSFPASQNSEGKKERKKKELGQEEEKQRNLKLHSTKSTFQVFCGTHIKVHCPLLCIFFAFYYICPNVNITVEMQKTSLFFTRHEHLLYSTVTP